VAIYFVGDDVRSLTAPDRGAGIDRLRPRTRPRPRFIVCFSRGRERGRRRVPESTVPNLLSATRP